MLNRECASVHGMTKYFPRLADAPLEELFSDLPVVSVVGPRACGKTTTASRLVPNVVHLDQKSVGQAFRADADAALRAVGEPVLLDEWQFAPEVLGAVKRAVDAGSGAGRFLLTGSVSAQFLPAQWPGTGRVTELKMAPLTVRELQGHIGHDSVLDRLASGDVARLQPAVLPAQALDISGYLELALRSGFPEAAMVPARSRVAWLESYRDQIVSRDAQLAREGIDVTRFGRYLEVVALHSATVTASQTLFDLAGVDRKTVLEYDHLLERLYLLAAIPAWSSRRVQRLVKTPKKVLVDAALMAAIVREDAEGIFFDAELRGRFMETFVAAQLRAELPFARTRPALYHLRDTNGRHEVDFVLAYSRGRIVGVEVKSSGTVTVKDAQHLIWLRDTLGEAFVCGVVLYTGAFTQELSDRIFAVPISTCWAPNQ